MIDRYKSIAFVAMLLGFQELSLAQLDSHSIRQMPGIVVAEKSAELAATVRSPLLELHTREGELVKKGQLLASLDYREAKAAYLAAIASANNRAQLELATIDVDEKKERLERIKQALKTGASNLMELERVSNEHRRAVVNLKLEKQKIEQSQHKTDVLKFQLESYLIRAPFDGIIVEIRTKIGNMLQPSDPIIKVVHYSGLNVDLNLPLELFGKLRAGQKYMLVASQPVARDIPAKLTFVSPVLDAASQTFLAKFTIDNHDLQLPAGFTVVLAEQQIELLSKGPLASAVFASN